MARATIIKKIRFEAAHFLPEESYKGKCNAIHGHSYKFFIGVNSDIDPKTGMVIDFSVLKKSVEACVSNLDHKLLNDIIPNPTIENIILWMWKYLAKEELIFNLEFIEAWETSSCCCIITKEDIISEYYDWIEEID